MAAGKTLPVGTLDQIRQAADLGEAVVPVPQWGLSVKVRGLTRGEVKAALELDDHQSGYLHYGLVEPTVTLDEAAELVAAKSWHALQMILEEIVRLSGLGAGFREGEAEAVGVRDAD